jgi:hypothetical protein
MPLGTGKESGRPLRAKNHFGHGTQDAVSGGAVTRAGGGASALLDSRLPHQL